MQFIVFFLSVATLGSFVWTVIQIIKPDWFYRAEEEANLKRQRPWWYLLGGVLGLCVIGYIWIQAFELRLVSVWILTAVFTLGSVKPLGMVFFYERFSEEASKLVIKMQDSKKMYWTIVLSRGILTGVLLVTTLYFLQVLSQIS
jgi:type VI protein secretion system component VasF